MAIEGLSTREGLVTAGAKKRNKQSSIDAVPLDVPIGPAVSAPDTEIGIGLTCRCEDKANCNCKTKPTRKTMTPEEEQASAAAAAAQQAPPPAEKTAPPPPAEGSPPEEEETSNELPSVQVSKAVYTSLKNLMGNLKAAENTYENPEAKEYFSGPFSEKCNEAMGEIKGLISKLGSGVDDDAEVDGEDEDEAMEEEEAMKSFLALGQTNDLKLLGIIAPLTALGKAKNLTAEQKLSINGVAKTIRALCDTAKQNSELAKQKALAAQVASLQSSYSGLAKSINDMRASMSELLPVG